MQNRTRGSNGPSALFIHKIDVNQFFLRFGIQDLPRHARISGDGQNAVNDLVATTN